ncbi:unnamed protein product [Musa acuminata subsp. burmannicoides]
MYIYTHSCHPLHHLSTQHGNLFFRLPSLLLGFSSPRENEPAPEEEIKARGFCSEGGRRRPALWWQAWGENLPTWEKGLLKLTSIASGPVATAPDARFPLVLAAKRTKRPDVLNKFRMYRGGWDITNKHYWASVAFTGAAGFLLALLWLVSFGLALAIRLCCGWGPQIKDEGSFCKQRVCLMLLFVFTCVASTGCILLSVEQAEFHDEVMDTLSFVVNQSDFTVQILRNVTDFLSSAKTVNVEEVYLPPDAQNEIDKLNTNLDDAANALSEKTDQNSGKIKGGIDFVHCTLIGVACLMLLLATLGFVFSICGYRHTIYIFIMSGWLLVAFTFVLCGTFVMLHNATVDTCTAMGEWVRYPYAETALSNVLPCVDEQTTNHTLYQSKVVVYQLVNIVNTAISSSVNSDTSSREKKTYSYNQSGPMVPYLCSPYDFHLQNRQCNPDEASVANASLVWENYTCKVADSGSCVSRGRLTPGIYDQLAMAVNVSYALYHYTPFLLSLQDCKFVRETFNTITTLYCPRLENNLRMVNAGLALISIGVLLCLILWIVNANRPHKGGGVCAAV